MDEKKSRSQFDQTEKSVFWSIVKTQQDGKLWKTITESKNNTARRDAWRAVAQAFANHIGKDFSAVQAKELFKRMKMAKKKDYDKRAIDRDFKKACSGTGGGPSPDPPFPEDGDDLEDYNDMDDFEPVETDFNVLVPPGDREFFKLGTATSTPRTSTGTKSNRKILGELNLNNRPSLSSPVTQSTKSAEQVYDRSSSCTNFPAVDGAVKELESRDSFGGSSRDEEEIIISDGNGNVQKVRAEKTKERVIQRKENIKAPKKSMNDEAANYYSSLLKIQTKLIKKKVKFYKRKENVEILKQNLLEAALVKEGLRLPVMNHVESSDTSGSDGPDSD